MEYWWMALFLCCHIWLWLNRIFQTVPGSLNCEADRWRLTWLFSWRSGSASRCSPGELFLKHHHFSCDISQTRSLISSGCSTKYGLRKGGLAGWDPCERVSRHIDFDTAQRKQDWLQLEVYSLHSNLNKTKTFCYGCSTVWAPFRHQKGADEEPPPKKKKKKSPILKEPFSK